MTAADWARTTLSIFLTMAFLFPLLIVVATLFAMEAAATATHRHVMHGFGWRWHRSHHEPRNGLLEKNDLYALIFALISLGLFVAGRAIPDLWWIGLGMASYGILYSILHDGLVHRRLPIGRVPRTGYIKRLVQAHRLHHATRTRKDAVSFGFLYAPPVSRLLAEMQSKRDRQ